MDHWNSGHFMLAVPAYAVDGTQLLLQIDRNLNPESYEMYRKIINVEPDGRKKEYTLFSVKKGVDKIAALFLAPASEKGRSTLRLGENMWLYIPNVGKAHSHHQPAVRHRGRFQ